MIAIFSVGGMLYYLSILFTSNLRFFYIIVLIFCFPVDWGLFHHVSTYFGSHILCSFISCTVFCSGHSLGLYCHSCCFSCCMHYWFSYISLLSCHLLYLHFSASIFYNSLYLPIWDLLLTACSVFCLSEDSTSWHLHSSLLLSCNVMLGCVSVLCLIVLKL